MDGIRHRALAGPRGEVRSMARRRRLARRPCRGAVCRRGRAGRDLGPGRPGASRSPRRLPSRALRAPYRAPARGATRRAARAHRRLVPAGPRSSGTARQRRSRISRAPTAGHVAAARQLRAAPRRRAYHRGDAVDDPAAARAHRPRGAHRRAPRRRSCRLDRRSRAGAGVHVDGSNARNTATSAEFALTTRAAPADTVAPRPTERQHQDLTAPRPP